MEVKNEENDVSLRGIISMVISKTIAKRLTAYAA
jgi:hypothetical protein